MLNCWCMTWPAVFKRLTAKTNIGFSGSVGAVFSTAFDGLPHLVDPSRSSQASAANRNDSSLRAVAHPEILRKINLSILVQHFVRRYVHSLKAHEWNHFELKYSQRTLSAAESKRAMPSPDVVSWVSGCRPTEGSTAAVKSRAGLQALQHRKSLKKKSLHLFTFPNISNAAKLITVFYLAVLKTMFVRVLILAVAILRKHAQESARSIHRARVSRN